MPDVSCINAPRPPLPPLQSAGVVDDAGCIQVVTEVSGTGANQVYKRSVKVSLNLLGQMHACMHARLPFGTDARSAVQAATCPALPT